VSLRSIVRGLIFLAAFTFEVRVRAAESIRLPLAEEVMQEPAGCLQKEGSCAIETGESEKYVLEIEGARIVLDAGTTILRVTGQQIRLVAGTVWVKPKAQFSIKTEFGEVIGFSGEFWARRDKQKMWVASVDSAVELIPRGHKDAVHVTPGMENWMGRVGKEGVATMGLPVAIQLKAHLERWARLYPGKKTQFEKDVKEFGPRWVEASAEAAQLHQLSYQRKVASLEAADTRKKEERRKVEEVNQRLRDLFRSKIFQDM
jgi:hypothetical protein